MSAARQRKAIVVGAGIGGLTAAIALRRAGLDAVVFERRTDPRVIESGGGMVLWNNAMRALQQLDLADEVAAAGSALERAEWRTPRGRLLAVWPVGEVGRNVGAPVIGTRRMKLQTVLTRTVGDTALQLGVECTGFTQDDDGITVRLADGREERADVLIGADGINSMVRAQRVGSSTAPRYAGYALWFGITDLRNDVAEARTFREVDGRGTRFIFFPISDGQTYWSAIANWPQGDVVEGSAPPGTKQELLARYRGWMEPAESLIEATDESAIYRREISDRDPMKHAWGEGRYTLLGDAAHPITPNLGQGAAQAIEDAVVLANALKDADDIPAALRDYESRRMARTASFAKRARMIGAMGRWSNPAACAIRDRLAKILIPGPALKQHRKDMAHEF